MSYDTIDVTRHGRVAVITLNRPKALNALNLQLMSELTDAAAGLDGDAEVGCIVITGGERAFAAGADIKEMQPRGYVEMYMNDWFAGWEALSRVRTPLVAAVAGYALGGGCELAMMCDVLVAADTAKFGQPEIKLGIMPGMGGSQRLTRAVGKAKAMEMCLTGRTIDAEEAVKTAQAIAGMAPLAVLANKEMVNAAFETSLAQGVAFERRLFHALFGTADQKEGMTAFVEKRPGSWRGK